ncbi:DUF6232 family protein [Streptomyces sp. NPDC060198]|uniref:DUF6232 family protein n=1 Tax=Streptomyces sp. NPDC060198 TaxID=3347070 RepID=UPI00365BE7E9
MLWFGSAAFPLHNLTRVEAFRLNPRRGEAFVSFLKWAAVIAVVYVAVMAMADEDASAGDGSGPLFFFVAVALAILLMKMLQPAKPILAVETAGGSWAVATLPSVDELRAIAGLIVHAIDHPEAEFKATVHQLNNYNGPVFNQTGGMNTGIKL